MVFMFRRLSSKFIPLLTRCALFCGIACFCLAAVASAGGKESYFAIAMNVGEQKMLPKKTQNPLVLSRKGIIDLQYLEDGAWRLTAMRRGLLFITEKSSSGEELARFFIKVDRAPEDDKESEEDGHSAVEKFLCSTEGVRCGLPKSIVEGETDSWQWFRKARDLCLSHQPCVFNVTLSLKAKEDLKRHYKLALGDWAELIAIRGTVAFAEVLCEKDDLKDLSGWIDALTSGDVKRGELVLACSGRYRQKDLYLKAIIFALDQGQAQKVGIDLNDSLTLKNPQLAATLFASFQQSGIKVIAEPLIKLQSGVPGTVVSGSEFKVAALSEKEHEYWKKVGMSLTATALFLADDRVRVRYQLELSSPHPFSTGSQIQSSSIASAVDLSLGKAEIIGATELTSEVGSKSSLPYWDQLPIIGPLLSYFGDSQSNSRLYIWLEVKNDYESPIAPPSPVPG
jgi:hypothetical protein